MFNAKTIRSTEKLFIALIIFLTATLFNSVMYAQNFGSLKKGVQINVPQKTYKAILDPLPAGTYTVGTSGHFATIQEAFNKLSIDGIAGEVTLELIDELYVAPTDSFGFLLNGPIPGANANSRVTIKPAANKQVTIRGEGMVTLSMYNTNYVTFDGVETTGPTSMTIHSLFNSNYYFNDGLDFFNNSDHNIIENIIFINESVIKPSGSGCWTLPGSTDAPDSNLIQNNLVLKAGISFFYTSTYTPYRGKDNIIRGNQIGTETDSLISWGIQIEQCENTIIENNIIHNLKITTGMLNDEKCMPGINSFFGYGDIIRNNVVHNLKSYSGYTCAGIILSGGPSEVGMNNQIYNNMVYNIQSTSSQSDAHIGGIEMWCQSSPYIYYNTIYLSGSGTNKYGSGGIYVHEWGNCLDIDLRNNIIINNRDEGQYCASSIYLKGSHSFQHSDYNDLKHNSNQYNCLVKQYFNDYHTLAEWQATGQDLNSINEIVNFNSSSDLHINNNYFTKLDGSATPIPGINTDFDNQPRNSLLPDIGADEFDQSINASNWQIQNSGFPASVFIVDFSAVNNQVCWAVAQKAPGNTAPYVGYVRTTDGGNNWVCDTIPGISNGYMQQIFAIDADTAYTSVYVQNGESSKGIYKTTNAGSTWTKQNAYSQSLYGPGYIHFFDSQNGVVIGDPNLESYTTSNGGLTWNQVTMPTPLVDESTWLTGDAIKAISNIVWFSTGARLFKSTDKGNTWTIIVSEPQLINWSGFIAFQDTLVGIYAHKKKKSIDHIYRKTTDGGLTWHTLSNSILDSITATAIQYIPGTNATYILTGDRHQDMTGTVITNDAGETWSVIDKNGNYQIIFPSNTVGWGSQWSANVIRKYVGQRITRIEEEQIDDVPKGYSLSQNYPNPFNPSTTFRYSIPNTSKVLIIVYDILGSEVVTLINEEKASGTYELTWNANTIPSGVYFYKLQAGDYVKTKKMILIK